MPGASRGQDVQDAVEHRGTFYRSPVRKIEDFPWPAGVTPWAANVRLRWWEVFLNNLPEVIVNFPEYHDLRFYLRGLIFLGSPL